MGKNKQAQRTKNNTRPSNSSRSAEFLGTAIPNFVGFSAVKDGGYVPVLPGLSVCSTNEVEMNNVDPKFQIVLKKMSKKDATTKCKALQEFAVMCNNSDLSAVEGMLPFWPRLYCVLAIDVEHRVREAAQLAHAAVVKRVGKGIAMYLKQLAGAWFTSQHDTYPPAASAAANSLNETFPRKKMVDAIIHCQREILTYINDNITVQTAQSLSGQKSLTAEEMESKYQKVLVASLQSYSFYLKKVPLQEIEKTADIHRKIITSAKFWKLVKHDALPIKTAFFNVLTSLIGNADILLQNEKKRTITAIMNSLDEMDPGLLAAVWEAVLVAINKIDDWYSVVSIEKLVLPKLWRVLRSGGQSCASIVYPNLLPFVSQFPKLNVNTRNLYVNFFNNMREGFSEKSVQISRSETLAVATSFAECLRYSILLNAADQNLCTMLLKEQLMPVLEVCLKENTSMKQILFCQITHLVRYWSKNRDNEDYKSYSCLIKEFWNALDTLFNSLIDASPDSESFNNPDMNNAQIEFLLTLRNVPSHNRKNLKVKFSEPDDDVKVDSQIKNIEIETDTIFLAELNNFVNSLCITYLKKISEQHTRKYIVYLNKLITCFEDKELFIALSKSSRTDINLFHFYNEVLRNWLLEKPTETEHIIELIFNFIKYMTDSEKDKILKFLTELDDVMITRNIVQCCLSKRKSHDTVISKWYSQSKVTSLIIDTAKEIASNNYDNLEKNQSLILLAFEPSEDGGLLINDESVNEIVSILCNSLHQVDEAYLLHFTKLISCIVPLTWAHKRSMSGAVKVLETLFELCIQDNFSNNSMFTDNIREVWKKGLLEAIKKLSHSQFIDLTKKFAVTIWSKLYGSHEECIKDILVDVAVDFVEVVINNYDNAQNTKEIILSFLTESDIKTWMAEATGIAMYGEVITGKLYVSTPEQKIQLYQDLVSIDLTSDTILDNIQNCLIWSLFNTSLLNNLNQRSCNDNIYKDEEVFAKQSTDYNLALPGVADILTNIIYSIILGQIYGNYYKSTKNYNNMNTYLKTIQNDFKQFRMCFNESVYNEIRDHIQENHSKYGSMLPYVIHFYCTELLVNENSKKLFENCRNNDASTTQESYLQAVQILQEYVTPEDISDDNVSALIIARSLLVQQDDFSSYKGILGKIISYDTDFPALLLLDCDISDIPWEKLSFPLEIVRLLAELVERIPTKLALECCDLTLISLILWHLCNYLSKSKRNPDDFKVATLTVAVCQLCHAFQTLIHKHKKEQIADLPRSLLDEWNAVFASDVQNGIIQTWMIYADYYNEKATMLKPVIVLDYLGKAITLLDTDMLFNEQSNGPSIMSDNFDKIITLSLKLLQSPVASIQLGAYHVLKHVVSEFVRRDKVTIEAEDFDPNTLNIKRMEDILQNTQNIVGSILMDFKLCDTVSCTIQPYTDSYTYTIGYLLAWAIILDMCGKAEGDLRYQYAEIIKDNFFPSLLNNIFRLMPVDVLQDNKNKNTKIVEMFTTPPCLDFGESWTEWRLDHIVCWLYTNSLRHLPVLVRQWWSTSDNRVSAAVDKITTHYISPMLCQEELQNNRLVNIKNMLIKVHPTAREVVALYLMDDTKLELSIVLPPNHPLGPVTVEQGQHAGSTANWRNCHMQLSIFLTHQNGSIWDGLALWKRNLDKKFADVEECCICFSIFHINTYQIPKMSCRTCRKKFHTSCLYKWFSTSQKSTCPICRNVF